VHKNEFYAIYRISIVTNKRRDLFRVSKILKLKFIESTLILTFNTNFDIMIGINVIYDFPISRFSTSPQVDLFIGFIFAGYAWTITCQFCILLLSQTMRKKKEGERHPTMRKSRRDEFAFLSLIADRHTINGE